MNEPTSERIVTLHESAWHLLDLASELDGDLSTSELIDLLVQGIPYADDGEVRSRESLAALRQLFGNNQRNAPAKK